MQPSASSAIEFEDKFGVLAAPLADEHNTAYKLTRALRDLTPPVYITDGVAKSWLAKFQGKVRILQAAQVEVVLAKHYHHCIITSTTTTTTTTIYYFLLRLHYQ